MRCASSYLVGRPSLTFSTYRFRERWDRPVVPSHGSPANLAGIRKSRSLGLSWISIVWLVCRVSKRGSCWFTPDKLFSFIRPDSRLFGRRGPRSRPCRVSGRSEAQSLDGGRRRPYRRFSGRRKPGVTIALRLWIESCQSSVNQFSADFHGLDASTWRSSCDRLR